MSNSESTIIEGLQKIDLSKLDSVTIAEVRQLKPRIFDKEPFTFMVVDLTKALIIPDYKTKAGSGNMYVLDTLPRIYTFANAYDQLEKYYTKNNLASGSRITYLKKFIPEGKDSFDTTYVFEVPKESKEAKK